MDAAASEHPWGQLQTPTACSMSPEEPAPPTPVTFQGHGLEETKLFQHLDEEDQDHQHRDHLKAFQVHGGGVSWPHTPTPSPPQSWSFLTPALQSPDHTSPGTPACVPKGGSAVTPLLGGARHRPQARVQCAVVAGGSRSHSREPRQCRAVPASKNRARPSGGRRGGVAGMGGPVGGRRHALPFQ